jgi:hypothetical protein
MVVFAIRIKHALTVSVDRLHHSHLSEDHRAAALRSLRHAMRGGSAPSPSCVLASEPLSPASL